MLFTENKSNIIINNVQSLSVLKNNLILIIIYIIYLFTYFLCNFVKVKTIKKILNAAYSHKLVK